MLENNQEGRKCRVEMVPLVEEQGRKMVFWRNGKTDGAICLEFTAKCESAVEGLTQYCNETRKVSAGGLRRQNQDFRQRAITRFTDAAVSIGNNTVEQFCPKMGT